MAAARIPALLAILLLGLPALVRADEPAATPPSSWSVGAGWVEGSALAGARGADLTLEHLAPEAPRGWRIGIGISTRVLSGTNTYRGYHFPGPDLATGGGVEKHSEIGIGLRLIRLHEAHPDRRTHLEWGFGPAADVSRTRDRLRDTQAWYANGDSLHGSYTGVIQAENAVWRVGVTGTFGVRWKATDDLEVLAEYDPALYWRRQIDDQWYDVPGSYGAGRAERVHLSGLEFDAQTVRVGVVAHL